MQLIEAGFEYVTDFGEVKLFRKRKVRKSFTICPKASSKFDYLRVRYSFNFKYSFRMDVALGDGLFDATFTNEVNNCRVANHANGFFQRGFSAIIKFVFDVKNDFSFSEGFAEKLTVTNGK